MEGKNMSNTKEERVAEAKVKEALKKVCLKHNLVVFKCSYKDSIIYTLGDAIGIVSKDYKILEKMDNNFFFDHLDVYGKGEDDEQDTTFKLLKLDNIQAAKVFTGVLEQTNKATITHVKCLDGTFTYNNLTMEGAITLLEKFISSTRYDDLRTLFDKIKSSGWNANFMSDAFVKFLKRNEKAFNSVPKERERFLSQLRVLYPKHIAMFNEALGVLPPVEKSNLFEEPKDFKVVYIDQKLIAQRFPIPFVDATVESGYYNAMAGFIKYLNTEDSLELLGAKSFEITVGNSAQKGKWVIMIRTKDDFSLDLFQDYILKCFERLVLLATQNSTSQAGGVNSHYLMIGMDKLYVEVLDSAVQDVMLK